MSNLQSSSKLIIKKPVLIGFRIPLHFVSRLKDLLSR